MISFLINLLLIGLRFSDHIDVVTESQYIAEYVREEDPKLFVSEKTDRGPLSDTWLDEHWHEVSDYMVFKLEFTYLVLVGQG